MPIIDSHEILGPFDAVITNNRTVFDVGDVLMDLEKKKDFRVPVPHMMLLISYALIIFTFIQKLKKTTGSGVDRNLYFELIFKFSGKITFYCFKLHTNHSCVKHHRCCALRGEHNCPSKNLFNRISSTL